MKAGKKHTALTIIFLKKKTQETQDINGISLTY